ncbi:hypothetical protein DFH09DRAFT_1070234 [Mycena vulgaris]|nr:hypothetical protein DFH09DRAFT_1070234 [Mycena vulgaris]
MPRAMHFLETELSLSISTGNSKSQSDLLDTLAWVEAKSGHYYAAQSHAYESRRQAMINADLLREAGALRTESICWKSLGNYSHSISLSKKARDLLGLCGMSGRDKDHIIMSTLAEVYRAKSEYVEARNIHTEIIQKFLIDQDTYYHALVLLNIAQIDVEIGASKQEVEKNIDVAKSTLNSVGSSTAVASCETTLASLNVREGNLREARTQFKKSLQISWGNDYEMVTNCLEKLGDTSSWHATGGVNTWTIVFLGYVLKSSQKLEIHKALQFLGDVYLAEGYLHTALAHFTVALDGFSTMDVHRSRAECILRLGDISKLQGQLLKAMELWKTARPLFERSSQAAQMAHIDERLVSIGRNLPDGVFGDQ